MVNSIPKSETGEPTYTSSGSIRPLIAPAISGRAVGNGVAPLQPNPQLLPSSVTTTANLTSSSSSNTVTTHVPQHREVAVLAPATMMGPAQPHPVHVQYTLPMQQSSHFCQTSLTSLAVFRDRPKKRSGKWTKEEEEYAHLLIDMFEKGLIDEKNGATLRSFLATRLNCYPMRISKKYAGKGIGKMVFLSKAHFSNIDPASFTAQLARLQDAEIKFLKVAYPGLSLQPQPISLVQQLPQTYPLPPLVPAPQNGASTLLQKQPVADQAPTVQTSYLTHPGMTNAPKIAPHQSHGDAYGGPMASLNPTLQYRPKSNTETLHQAYSNVILAQNGGVSQINGATVTQPIQVPPSTAVQTLHQAFLRAKSGPASQGNGETKSEKSASKTASTSSPNEIPDFLSGFDKVTGRKGTVVDGGNTHIPHTPTYTSKSFDDFHRLLGKNLSPLTLQKNAALAMKIPSQPSLPESNTVPANAQTAVRLSPKPAPLTQAIIHNVWPASDSGPTAGISHVEKESDSRANYIMLDQAFREALQASNGTTPNHLGADLYNMLAQESAFEASKHSAYSIGRGQQAQGQVQETSLPTHIGDTLSSISDPRLVSEPASSEHGTEGSDESRETSGASGTESSGSNAAIDSDGTNSEGSMSKKKARYSYEQSSKRTLNISHGQGRN